MWRWEIDLYNANFISRPSWQSRCGADKVLEKLCNGILPYLNTTTSKQVEYTKAFEITIIKELGKMTP